MTAERAPRADLRARVLADVARAPSPTRAEYNRRILLVAALGTVATVALFMGMGGVSRGTRPVEMVAFTVGFGLVAVAVLTRLSSRSGGGRSMLGRPRGALLAAVVGSAPLLAIVAVLAAMLWPESAAADHAEGGVHLACGAMSVLQGALPLIALMVPRRGTDPVHPAVTGAALGMTAGAWTVVMAYLRCPHTGAVHCVLAHVVPTLILTALGALLGWVFLRVRFTPER